MTETKHTPGEWKLADYDNYDGHICFRGGGEYLGEVSTNTVGFEIGEANAKFIIKAVNSHDELIAALQTFHEKFTAFAEKAVKYEPFIPSELADEYDSLIGADLAARAAITNTR